jgi:hypothetical protein
LENGLEASTIEWRKNTTRGRKEAGSKRFRRKIKEGKDDDKRLRETDVGFVMIRKKQSKERERKEKPREKKRESDIVSTSEYNPNEIETPQKNRNKKNPERG